MSEPVFNSVHPILFEMILRGASSRFGLAYSGTTMSGHLYGGRSVGPEAWRSDDGRFVLLAFRGSDQCEYAIVELDPTIEPDPIPTYMARYGDALLQEEIEVSRVSYQKVVAGDQWSEDASVGVSSPASLPDGYSSYFQISNYGGGEGNQGFYWTSQMAAIRKEYGSSKTLALQTGVLSGRYPTHIRVPFELLRTGEYWSDRLEVELTLASGQSITMYIFNNAEVEIDWSSVYVGGEGDAIREIWMSGAEALIYDIQFADTDATEFGGGDGGGGGE